MGKLKDLLHRRQKSEVMANVEVLNSNSENDSATTPTPMDPPQSFVGITQTFEDIGDSYTECQICEDVYKPMVDPSSSNRGKRASKVRPNSQADSSRAPKVSFPDMCHACDQSRIKSQGRFKICPSLSCSYAVEEPPESSGPAACKLPCSS
jgi:hypothetical protein